MLTLAIEAIPVGATLTDGVRSFTATEGSTTADLTGWSLAHLSLTAPADFNGQFQLNVVATATETSNGDTRSSSMPLTVTVLPVNDAPVALNAIYQVAQGGSVDIDFSALVADVDGNALTLALTSPAHGTLTRNADGSYRFTPAAGYAGLDSFTYALKEVPLGDTVNDGRVSSTGKVTLNVLGDDADGSASIIVQSVASLGTRPSNPPNNGHLVYGSAADLKVVAAATFQPSGLTVDWTAGVATMLGKQSCGPSSVDEKWLKELLGAAEKLDLATQMGLVVKVQR